MDERRLRVEALRIYHRYATEVVEALGLCPWARRAREHGQVRPEVVLSAEPTADEVLALADSVFADQHIDIGLILFPRLDWNRAAFRRFVSQVRACDAARHDPGPSPLAMAEFHPQAEPDMTSPARLVSFVRRSPDPTIQMVRHAALDAVQGSGVQGTAYAPRSILFLDEVPAKGSAPLHQRIAEANHATISRMGVERVKALLDEIRADRDGAYARIVAGHS